MKKIMKLVTIGYVDSVKQDYLSGVLTLQCAAEELREGGHIVLACSNLALKKMGLKLKQDKVKDLLPCA